MRWDSLRLTGDDGTQADNNGDTPGSTGNTAVGPPGHAPGNTGQQELFSRAATITRTFDTPGFRGITFHEIQARSIISKVPEASRVPFRWTINPYRGCSHACVYCFARNT